MTDPKPPTSEPDIVITPEQHQAEVIKRNAEEALYDDEGDDDISDLGEIEALFDED